MEREHLENLRIDGRIALKFDFIRTEHER